MSSKKICVLLGAIVSLLGSSIFAAPLDTTISIKNSHASYTNGGICSLAFDLMAYAFLDNVREIKFNTTLKDRKGNIIGHDVSSVSEFTMVSGKTYGSFFIESEQACKAFGETVVINKANVYYNDGTKSEDIVKTKKLEIDSFKPVKIIIGSK